MRIRAATVGRQVLFKVPAQNSAYVINLGSASLAAPILVSRPSEDSTGAVGQSVDRTYPTPPAISNRWRAHRAATGPLRLCPPQCVLKLALDRRRWRQRPQRGQWKHGCGSMAADQVGVPFTSGLAAYKHEGLTTRPAVAVTSSSAAVDLFGVATAPRKRIGAGAAS